MKSQAATSHPFPGWVMALLVFWFSFVLLIFSFTFGLSGLVFYPTSVGLCLILWIYVDERSLQELGMWFTSRWWVGLFTGLVLGGLFMVVLVVGELQAGWIALTPTFTDPGEIGVVASLLGVYIFWQVVVAAGEEIVARGYIQQKLGEDLSTPMAVLIASMMFSLLHLPSIVWSVLSLHLGIIMLVNLLLAGLALGWGFAKTRALWLPIGIHFAWNFFEYHVFGFAGNWGLCTAQNLGPELLTGGVMGPEAGLVGMVAFTLLLAVVWLLTSDRFVHLLSPKGAIAKPA